MPLEYSLQYRADMLGAFVNVIRGVFLLFVRLFAGVTAGRRGVNCSALPFCVLCYVSNHMHNQPSAASAKDSRLQVPYFAIGILPKNLISTRRTFKTPENGNFSVPQFCNNECEKNHQQRDGKNRSHCLHRRRYFYFMSGLVVVTMTAPMPAGRQSDRHHRLGQKSPGRDGGLARLRRGRGCNGRRRQTGRFPFSRNDGRRRERRAWKLPETSPRLGFRVTQFNVHFPD